MKRFFAILLVISLILASSGISFAASSADKSLDKLSVSKSKSTSSSKTYDLFPKFDPKVADYNVFLPDDTNSAYIYMKPDDKDYKVYCDGEEVDDDDDYYASIKKIKDGDEIEIVVKDEDDKKLDTYTITFFCGDEDDDDEAALDSLSVKTKEGKDSYSKVSLNKDFDEDVKDYKATVKENDYDTIRIYAEAKDSGAHVLINGELMDDDYLDCKVSTGKNEFDIDVIAENCDDTKKYTLTVTYDSSDTEDDEKTEAVISSLSVKDNDGNTVSLSPAFNSGKKNYTANVGNTVQSVNFYTTTGTNMKMYLNNTELNNAAWSQNYTLKEGPNNFAITVYLTGDSYDIKTYNVSIYKHAKKLESLVSVQNLNVNGTPKQLNAYNISGSNFVKLRDIASILSGTNKQFSVGYNEATNAIALLSGGYYTANGQENQSLKASKDIMISIQSLTLDNQSTVMAAYNIDGNNYVMLRDVALLLNFGLTYNSATDTIQITTSNSYSVN
ncbi:cadherin-like beta sandwich domain-containing protein [Aminipila luticellarii]|uniref:Cadherin-like beta sandwich domain-containing protein n=1 Tax=Aminipila luticellarii TaxID=2507160 RepID=A0A410PUK2_9FIRM|nr:cadherin-like beta sandwich domain-containing protein [Aminipila luticellarii]QAT42627.1 cadherin-like beta sandwich domain-containing protein [Aminipila luticellarii]